MTNIELKNLNFAYGAELIFDHADINIDDRWKLGLVGRNGRGKSTLLKILQGKIKIDSFVSSDKHFVYFPQALTDLSALTFYALSELADFEQWEMERELSLLRVDLDVLWRPFDTLSGGEQTKCLLALLFLDEQNFPLIDEPTNHLDIESRKIVSNYLKKKMGFIVVSHDRDFLNETTDHTLAIERQKISLYQGNFSVYEAEKKLRDEFEQAEDIKLHKDISRLKQTAREKENWSRAREKTKDKAADSGFVSARAARMMQKSKNLERRMNQEITDKEKLLKNIEKITPLEMDFVPTHHKTLLSCENFTLDINGKILFEPIDFEIKQGEIIALTGENGAGKSSILKFLRRQVQGEEQVKFSGKMNIAQNLKISYIRQIYNHQGFLTDFAEQEKLNVEIFLANLRKLGMERSTFAQKIETMSQGQQKKVEVARSLSQAANLYVWDEPLNYLDVFNHEQIEAVLQSVKPSMLIVEHDRYFIDRIAHREVKLKK